MADLTQIANRLRQIDVVKIFNDVLTNHLPQIEEFNREQLKEGIRSDGTSMPKHSKSKASEIYIDDKIERGVYDQSIYPAMNFYDKGDFQKGITAKNASENENLIVVYSTDSKADELEDLGGSKIYGNTEENLSKIREEMIPEMQDIIRNKLKA